MAYQCRQCNRVGSEAGACPVCNIPMDIRLQETQPDMTPVVPAEEVTPDVPMPEVLPKDPVVVEDPDKEETPAEGGDPTMA